MSKFVVSARKYRPQTFDQVIGQNHISDTLKNALVSEQLAHAFLFCGPRGVGKTTCARVLAKVLNCENLQNDQDPCNSCSSCTAFNDNASFNIIELDAASNNSVDHIRTLIEQVRFQPQQGKYKVFIIDEVHMLSTAAFNAFLKTLEEPPSYAIFILATTEKHKVLPTILSRCQVFDFKRIQVVDIVHQLENIVKEEGLTAEPEALQIIAQKADGAMRDALSIYDKIASSSSKEITYKNVIKNLNVLDFDYYFKVVDAFVREDLNDVLLIFDDILKQGFDPDLFVQGLGQHCRDILVSQHQKTLQLLEVGDGLKQRYTDQSQLASRSLLLNALNILNKCDVEMQRAQNKRLHVEIALGKITYVQRTIDGTTSVESHSVKKNSNHKPSLEKDRSHSDPNENQETHSAPAKTTSPKPSVSSDTSPSQKIEKPKSSLLLSKKISDLGAIRSEIKQEEAEKAANTKELNLEDLESIWKSYQEELSSNSARLALKNVHLEVEGSEIKVFVPNSVSKDLLVQEIDLIQKIRETFNKPELGLNIEIDLERFPNQENYAPKKMLTNREKYELLSTKNPLLVKLKNTFDLGVDNQ